MHSERSSVENYIIHIVLVESIHIFHTNNLWKKSTSSSKIMATDINVTVLTKYEGKQK
jgi:hypothetical protein